MILIFERLHRQMGWKMLRRKAADIGLIIVPGFDDGNTLPVAYGPDIVIVGRLIRHLPGRCECRIEHPNQYIDTGDSNQKDGGKDSPMHGGYCTEYSLLGKQRKKTPSVDKTPYWCYHRLVTSMGLFNAKHDRVATYPLGAGQYHPLDTAVLLYRYLDVGAEARG